MRRMTAFSLVVTLSLGGGCHHYATVAVDVVWDETGRPAVGVPIRPSYHTFMDPFPPNIDVVQTETDGKATLPIAIDPSSGYAGLFAEGYTIKAGQGVVGNEYRFDLGELRRNYEAAEGAGARDRPVTTINLRVEKR